MENIKFFIIVPIYNVESYLKECLDSIIYQTYTEFEAILVDDGSTDSSWAIAEKYVKKDSRLMLIHQENQGVSMARNKGLDVARQKSLIPPPSKNLTTPQIKATSSLWILMIIWSLTHWSIYQKF